MITTKEEEGEKRSMNGNGVAKQNGNGTMEKGTMGVKVSGRVTRETFSFFFYLSWPGPRRERGPAPPPDRGLEVEGRRASPARVACAPGVRGVDLDESPKQRG